MGTEAQRVKVYGAVAEHWGEEVAVAVMELLPPQDTDDFARRSDLARLRGEFGELRGEFGQLKGEFGELKADFGELRGEFGELRGEFGELRGEFGELKGQFSALSGKVDAQFSKIMVANVTMMFGFCGLAAAAARFL